MLGREVGRAPGRESGQTGGEEEADKAALCGPASGVGERAGWGPWVPDGGWAGSLGTHGRQSEGHETAQWVVRRKYCLYC